MNEIDRSHGVATGLSGPLLVIHYDAPTVTIEAVIALERASARVPTSRAHLGTMVVIEGKVRPPDPMVRAAMQDLMRRFEERTLALAYVIRADGFGGAAARAAVTGMLLFNRPKYPFKVFSNIRDGVLWAASKPGLSARINRAATIIDIEQFCAKAAPAQAPTL